jgi:mono/diheme cytochrome c family protein
MKNRAGYAGFVRYLLVFPLTIAAACSSADGESSSVGSEQQVDGSVQAGAPGGQNEAGSAPLAAGGETSHPDPIASGSGGSVGDEPAEEPAPSLGGDGGTASGPSGDAGAGNDEPPEPAGPSEAFLRGQELVKQNACVTCHQADYSGFTVFPNITPDAETGIGAWSDEQIIGAIRGGRDADGSTLCITMQRYAFSDDQVADVVAFLRGIPAVSHRIASTCPGHGG